MWKSEEVFLTLLKDNVSKSNTFTTFHFKENYELLIFHPDLGQTQVLPLLWNSNSIWLQA